MASTPPGQWSRLPLYATGFNKPGSNHVDCDLRMTYNQIHFWHLPTIKSLFFGIRYLFTSVLFPAPQQHLAIFSFHHFNLTPPLVACLLIGEPTSILTDQAHQLFYSFWLSPPYTLAFASSFELQVSVALVTYSKDRSTHSFRLKTQCKFLFEYNTKVQSYLANIHFANWFPRPAP